MIFRGSTNRSGTTPSAGTSTASVYVMRGGKPQAVHVLTGITDGVFTEVKADSLRPDDQVIVGLDLAVRGAQAGAGGAPFGGRR